MKNQRLVPVPNDLPQGGYAIGRRIFLGAVASGVALLGTRAAHAGGQTLAAQPPEGFVPMSIPGKIVKVARVWMDRFGRESDVYRFDCIGLVDNKIEHVEDAFRPGWR